MGGRRRSKKATPRRPPKGESRASALAQLLSDKLFDCGVPQVENWTVTVDLEERQKLKKVFRQEILSLIETQRLLQLPSTPQENVGWSLSQLRVKQKNKIRRRQEKAAKAYNTITEEKTSGIEWYETISPAHMHASRIEHNEPCFGVENVKEGLEMEETKWCSRMLRARMPGPYDLAWSLRRLIKFQEALAEDIAALNLSPRDPLTKVAPFTEIDGGDFHVCPEIADRRKFLDLVEYTLPQTLLEDVLGILGKRPKKKKKNELSLISKYLLVRYISTYESASQPSADLQEMHLTYGNSRFQNNVLPVDSGTEFPEAYRSFWKVLPQVVALGELQDHFKSRAAQGNFDTVPPCMLECLSSLIDVSSSKSPCLACVQSLATYETPSQTLPVDMSLGKLRIGCPKQRFRVSNPIWSEWVGFELLLEAEKVRAELAMIEMVYSDDKHSLSTKSLTHFDHEMGSIAMSARYHRWFEFCVKKRLPLQWGEYCLPPRLAFLRRDRGRGEWNSNRPGFITIYELINQEKDDRVSVMKLSGISAEDMDLPKSLSIIVGAVSFLLVDDSKLDKGCICTNVKVSSSRVFLLPSVRSVNPAFRFQQSKVSLNEASAEILGRERNNKVCEMLNSTILKYTDIYPPSEYMLNEDDDSEVTTSASTSGSETADETPCFKVVETTPFNRTMGDTMITRSTIVPLKTDLIDVYIQLPNKTVCDILEAAYLMVRKAVATWVVALLNRMHRERIEVTAQNIIDCLTIEWARLRVVEPLIHMADCALPPHAYDDCSDDDESDFRQRDLDETFLHDMATSMCSVAAEYYPATFDEVWLQLATPLGPVINALWFLALRRSPDRPTVTMPNNSTLVLVGMAIMEMYSSHGVNYSAIEEGLFGIESGTFAIQPSYSAEFKLAWLDELRRRRDQWL